MYGKIFDSIFDSTLAADGGWLPTYVFISMVINADKDGIVDIAPKALFRRIGFREYDSKIEYADFESAISYLEKPDPGSRLPDMDGRRIIPLSECDDVPTNRGWRIVNYAYYRDKGRRNQRAADSTDRVRRFRERQEKAKKNNDETQCNAMKRRNAHTDTDIDITLPTEVAAPAKSIKDQIWELGPKVLGNARADRSYLGKAIKDHGEGSVLHALLETQKQGTGDPKAYMQGILKSYAPVESDGFGAFDD